MLNDPKSQNDPKKPLDDQFVTDTPNEDIEDLDYEDEEFDDGEYDGEFEECSTI